jgi:hypothetical protein
VAAEKHHNDYEPNYTRKPMNLTFLLAIVAGVFALIWPYKLARLEEQFDSIGSKRSWSEVEPADWKVTFTRVTGAVAVLLGIDVLIAG